MTSKDETPTAKEAQPPVPMARLLVLICVHMAVRHGLREWCVDAPAADLGWFEWAARSAPERTAVALTLLLMLLWTLTSALFASPAPPSADRGSH